MALTWWPVQVARDRRANLQAARGAGRAAGEPPPLTPPPGPPGPRPPPDPAPPRPRLAAPPAPRPGSPSQPARAPGRRGGRECVLACVRVCVCVYTLLCCSLPLQDPSPSYTVSHLFLLKATTTAKRALEYFSSSLTGRSGLSNLVPVMMVKRPESQGWKAPGTWRGRQSFGKATFLNPNSLEREE